MSVHDDLRSIARTSAGTPGKPFNLNFSAAPTPAAPTARRILDRIGFDVRGLEVLASRMPLGSRIRRGPETSPFGLHPTRLRADNTIQSLRHWFLLGGVEMWNREASTKDEGQRPTPSAPVMPAVGPPPITTRPVEEERRLVAWVGKSVLFRGDLISLEDMTIDGRVEGTIELRDHTLTIGPDAAIQADIVAKAVSILGKVTGSISASETIYIGETGFVEGNITSRRVSMADGAVVRGRVETSGRAAENHTRRSQATAAV